MCGAVMREPFLTALERFWFFLIRTRRVKDVMVVDVVDGFQIGFRSEANSDGRGSEFREGFVAPG